MLIDIDADPSGFILFPLVICSFDIIVSAIGIASIKVGWEVWLQNFNYKLYDVWKVEMGTLNFLENGNLLWAAVFFFVRQQLPWSQGLPQQQIFYISNRFQCDLGARGPALVRRSRSGKFGDVRQAGLRRVLCGRGVSVVGCRERCGGGDLVDGFRGVHAPRRLVFGEAEVSRSWCRLRL